jgi:hypothetical protein
VTGDGKFPETFPTMFAHSFLPAYFFTVICMFRDIFTILSVFYSIIYVWENFSEIFITSCDFPDSCCF